MKISLFAVACAALITQSTANAAGIVTTTLMNAAQFAAYQAGKTVQNFENVSGVPGWNIANFNSNVAVSTLGGGPGNDLLATWGATQDGFIVTSGGNVPGGIFNLTGGLTGASSGTHVLARLGSDSTDSSGNENTCFTPDCNNGMAFEFFFSKPVTTVGFYINAATGFLVGTQNVGISVANAGSANPSIVRDSTNASNFNGTNAPAATYLVLTSTAADISSVSIGFATGSTANFIDDVTFSRGAAPTTTPEPSTLAFAGLALSALIIRHKMK